MIMRLIMLTIILTLVLIMHFIVQILFLNIYFCHRLCAYVLLIKTVIPFHFYYPKHTSLLPLGNVHNNEENKRIDKKMFFSSSFCFKYKKNFFSLIFIEIKNELLLLNVVFFSFLILKKCG